MVSLRVSCSGFFCYLFAYTESCIYSGRVMKNKISIKLFFLKNLNLIKN